MTNTVDIVVGRLIEIDLAAGFRTPQDIDEIVEKILDCFACLASGVERAVIFSDWRACQLFAPETAEQLLTGLARVNPRIERSALLHNTDQPMSVLQVTRVIRSGKHPERRVFTKQSDAIKFLSGCLTPPEVERLKVIASRHPSR